MPMTIDDFQTRDGRQAINHGGSVLSRSRAMRATLKGVALDIMTSWQLRHPKLTQERQCRLNRMMNIRHEAARANRETIFGGLTKKFHVQACAAEDMVYI